jgi:hypothetical protein
VVLVLLLTVHGHVHHVDGSEYHGWGPRGSSSGLRVPRAPQARWNHAAGGRALPMTSPGLRQGGEMSPETPIMAKASPQGSSEIEFDIHALSG